ncbi:hypothetical protein C8R43DRAFT_1125055 [Mycena crocata]|nr:hypothetical protein C8R43DRAFT_1125055 [Mycena crocata]
MPDVATQTEVESDSLEHRFKQEVLDYVEGHGAPPSSQVLQWLGRHAIPAKQRPQDPKELESAVMAQIRKERSELIIRFREGWEERNEGRPWLQFYPQAARVAHAKKMAQAVNAG